MQARSQDLEKGGGLFWKSEKCANHLDSNFHWTWISFRRFVRKLRRNFSESSEIQRFFSPKIRCSPKKKGLHWNWEWFFGRNPKFKDFFRPKSGVLQRKKKGLHWNYEWFFGRNPKFKGFFRPKSGVLQRKKKGLHWNYEWFFGRNPKFKGFFRPIVGGLQKKKKVFTEIETDFSSNFTNSDVWGGAVFVWGGAIFNVSQKIGLKSTKNMRFCLATLLLAWKQRKWTYALDSSKFNATVTTTIQNETSNWHLHI